MMNQDRFEAGKATDDLDTSEMKHDGVAGPVWAAIQATIAAMDPKSPGEQMLCQLLRAVKETHGSMRAVYTAAAAIENSEEQSGRWTDMLVLARAQFDALFNGLLIADDEARWTSAYKKAAWKTMAQRHFYESRRFENTPAGEALKTVNVPRLRRLATWGLTRRRCGWPFVSFSFIGPVRTPLEAARIRSLKPSSSHPTVRSHLEPPPPH